MKFRLDTSHDASALAEEFARDGRVRIMDFLQHEDAKALLAELHSLPWNLVYRKGGKVVEITPSELQKLTPQDAAAIRQTVDQGAREGFQFLYNNYPLMREYFTPGRRERDVFRAYEMLNSPQVLELLRTVTGMADVRWLDAHGSLYQANQFLKYHTDESAEEPRLAAYVLSLVEDWDLDWGGLLQFWTDDNDVECALRPRFNAMNVFAVPRRHSVSQVASYAPPRRFAVTGWLRADEPPAAIPWSG